MSCSHLVIQMQLEFPFQPKPSGTPDGAARSGPVQHESTSQHLAPVTKLPRCKRVTGAANSEQHTTQLNLLYDQSNHQHLYLEILHCEKVKSSKDFCLAIGPWSDDKDDTWAGTPLQTSAPLQWEDARLLRMIYRTASPIHDGSSMESGFEPGSPLAPKPRPYHWAIAGPHSINKRSFKWLIYHLKVTC
ncbi:hypothetical protein AVEN_243753-1 [Araneus ventricosus]|uniref:Uncharacterized protein n=1 Tax=Araneus ventricosus TaxID=182803 RepID=A0A4Y2A5U8_ARAVE|nr:hypothetical protein AVEN_243753-1 [Araneus ventricosus]